MLLLLVISLTFFSSCGKQNLSSSDVFTSSIVGGEEIHDESFHETIALVTPIRSRTKIDKQGRGMPFCSGILIDKTTIQTAAHCLLNIQNDDYLKQQILEEMESELGLEAWNNPLEIQKWFQNYLLEKSQNILIHRGNGQLFQGFTFDFLEGDFTVESYSMNQTYFKYLLKELFGIGEEISFNDLRGKDLAKLHLSVEMENTSVFPKVTREELNTLVRDGTEVIAVGFGSKFDYKVVNHFKDILRETIQVRNELVTNENVNANELVSIERRINALESYIEKHHLLSEQFGSKARVNLIIKSIQNESIVISTKEYTSKLQGICDGDSGGPVFIQLPNNGELKLLGIISTGTYCGYGANISLTLE